MATILVVDDSPVDRNLVGGLLKMAPSAPTVRFACNGREAMEFIRHEVPQLVVTDLMMPEMDGLDLVADIVKTHASVPVVLMTGAGSEEIAVQALRAGAASYVPKSALADMLVETIESLLELSREEQRQTDLMSCMTRCSCDFVLGNDSRMIPRG